MPTSSSPTGTGAVPHDPGPRNGSPPAKAPKNGVPNILFLQLDQLAPHSLKFHGNPTSKTPTIDYLMEHGVVFDNAYCASPICTPSRMAMLTGQMITKIDAFDNAAELRSEELTIAHGLRLVDGGGYLTILAGKMHFVGADQVRNASCRGGRSRCPEFLLESVYGYVVVCVLLCNTGLGVLWRDLSDRC